ncbi:2-dehydropantoate 2-reductase [Catenulispora acidiphila DSM 44928]|uniref:2-dehydropantoate 2-reductase n=1 Tax=Catenulispora acidiphila (strain DSM 44928 / JCM 14897 / NBRC 102108 / NRRL B-24433 / ID139908) TaxID=479433 RepID=C7Q2C5_CATAD|nr:2-dehydropantoate 2-reductase [Catenulispora acidiphila]ACU69767.1 2-dehydropantoate 2-reductase [Catenulispora acidiphila DSM 44928]
MADIAVVGPGAIGSVAALAAQQTGRHSVTLCARRDPGALRVVDDVSGGVTDLEAPILTSPAEVTGPADWVLLAVKAHQTDGAAGYLDALCKPSTTVVALQNGVEHVERVAPYVNDAQVLPAIVWISAEPTGPGEVTVRNNISSLLQVPAGPAGEEFARLLEGASAVEVELVSDFTTAAWRKLTTNAIAGVMAVTGRRAAIYQRPDVRELALALAQETLAVARAEGAALPESEAEALVGIFERMDPDIGSSILFDRLAGRELEWDARNGVVRRLGRRHGIPTPVSDVLVPLLSAASDG